MALIYKTENSSQSLVDSMKIWLSKNAQQINQTTNADQAASARNLVDRLISIYDNGGHEVSSSNQGEQFGVKTKDLTNLSTLLTYLLNNQVMIDGQRIVYKENQLNEEQAAGWKLFSPLGKTNQADMSKNSDNYYVNQDALQKYIYSLQFKADKSVNKDGNKILQVMVGKLIDEAKSPGAFPDINLERSKQKSSQDDTDQPEKKKISSVKPDTVLDSFNTKTFNDLSQYALADQGTQFFLMARDLSSNQTLNAWMTSGKEATIITHEKDGRSSRPYSKGNKCIVLQNLFLRAKNLKNNIKSPEDADKADYYLSQLSKIVSQFADPSGKTCQLSGLTSNESQGWEGNVVNNNKNNSADGKEIVQLEYVLNDLPLRLTDISFQRINQFFESYQKLPYGSSPEAMGQISKAVEIMEIITKLLQMPMSIFPMSASPSDVKIWMKKPEGKYFALFCENMEVLLNSIYYVISDMVQKYEKQIQSMGPSIYNKVYSQIGSSPNSSSVFKSNINIVREWKGAAGLNGKNI